MLYVFVTTMTVPIHKLLLMFNRKPLQRIFIFFVPKFHNLTTLVHCSRFRGYVRIFNNDSSSQNGHEGERNNCFSKIQLVGQKYRDKTTLASKTRFSRHCFGFQSRRFSLLVDYNIQPSSSSTNQNTALVIDHQLDFTKSLQYSCGLWCINHQFCPRM